MIKISERESIKIRVSIIKFSNEPLILFTKIEVFYI